MLITTQNQHFLGSTAKHIHLKGFDSNRNSSLRLFKKIVGNAQTKNIQNEIIEISNLLGHLPLAIKIAASRIKYSSNNNINTFKARLLKEQNKLDKLSFEHDDVRRSFNSSYTLLGKNERLFFQSLGVFDGNSFNIKAIPKILNISISVVESLIENLYRLSLLEKVSDYRYKQHTLLHSFAIEKSRLESKTENMIRFYILLIVENQYNFEALSLEKDNLYSALNKAYQLSFFELYLTGLNKVYDFWELNGYFLLAKEHLFKAKQIVSNLHLPYKVKILTYFTLAKFEIWQSNFSEAEIRIAAGLDLAKQTEETELKPRGLRLLGLARGHSGNHKEAITLLEDAKVLFNSERLFRMENITRNELGTFQMYAGKLKEAQHNFEKSLSSPIKAKDKINELKSFGNLGAISMRQGSLQEAEEYFRVTLKICKEIKNRGAEAKTLGNLGILNALRGNYDEAYRKFTLELQIYRDINLRPGECGALINLGTLSFDQDNLSQSKEFYEEALTISQNAKIKYSEANILTNLANVNLLLGNFGDSRLQITQAEQVFQTNNSKEIQISTLDVKGRHSFLLGKYDEAQKQFEEAYQISQEISHLDNQSNQLTNLSLICCYQNDFQSALKFCKRALNILDQTKSIRRKGKTLLVKGHAELGLGFLSDAEKTYQSCYEFRSKLNQPNHSIESHVLLAYSTFLQVKSERTATLFTDDFKSELHKTTLEGALMPQEIFFLAYTILKPTDHKNSSLFLKKAMQFIQNNSRLLDELDRKHYFERVHINQLIMTEYEALIDS
ncbi:MAG: tetratricopeptide repeat protein [Chloroflexota bacterium]